MMIVKNSVLFLNYYYFSENRKEFSHLQNKIDTYYKKNRCFKILLLLE